MILAAFLLAIAGYQAQPAVSRDSRPPAAQASISGRVTARDSGQPLPRIVVTLRLAGGSADVRAFTDADGRFHLGDLAAGKYVLSAAPDEHRSTYLRQRYGETEPAPPFDITARPNIELATGEHKSGVDIALWRALAIEGRVSDPWDRPMARVQIAVTRLDKGMHYGPPAFTDDLGQYRVYGLTPGRYRVCARIGREVDVPPSDTSRLGRTCHPSALAERDAGDVVLRTEDAFGIDIRVQQTRSHTISGFVVDAGGRPADGVSVSAAPIGPHGGTSYAVTRGGEFVLRGLTPGPYIVGATAGDSVRHGTRTARETEVGYASADASAGDVVGVTVAMSKPVSVAGRVTFEGTRPRGRLGMVVYVRPVPDAFGMFERRPPLAAVDDDLAFELNGLHRVPVLVAARGVPDGWVIKSVRYEDSDITHVPTDFASRGLPGRLQIVLTNRIVRAAVRVVDAQGAPATSFHVVAVPADRSAWQFALSVSNGSGARDGVLKLEPLLAGAYVLAAIPYDDFSVLMRDRSRVEAVATIGTRVTLAEGDTTIIDLPLVSLPAAR